MTVTKFSIRLESERAQFGTAGGFLHVLLTIMHLWEKLSDEVLVCKMSTDKWARLTLCSNLRNLLE